MQEMTEEQRKEMEEKLKNMSPEELREFQKQQCIFCQIISGKIPSKKIYEDDTCLAILDINPAAEGHLLIIPKEHYSIMPQMPAEELGHLFVVSRNLSKLLLKALKVDGTNLFVANGLPAGQKAQHFMIHMIPRKGSDGVLEIEEKLIDKEMVKKIKDAVEIKLNEILGIKMEQKGEKVQSSEATSTSAEPAVKEEETPVEPEDYILVMLLYQNFR